MKKTKTISLDFEEWWEQFIHKEHLDGARAIVLAAYREVAVEAWNAAWEAAYTKTEEKEDGI